MHFIGRGPSENICVRSECRLGTRSRAWRMHVIISRLRGGSVTLHVSYLPLSSILIMASLHVSHLFEQCFCICCLGLPSHGVCAGIASIHIRYQLKRGIRCQSLGMDQDRLQALHCSPDVLKFNQSLCLLEICVCYENPSIIKLDYTDFCFAWL